MQKIKKLRMPTHSVKNITKLLQSIIYCLTFCLDTKSNQKIKTAPKKLKKQPFLLSEPSNKRCLSNYSQRDGFCSLLSINSIAPASL